MKAWRFGLIGQNGAGKSTVCRFFGDNGFRVFSLSDIVRDEATLLGLSLTREHLIDTANRLKQREGTDVLARQVMAKASGVEKVIFDSIRHVDEVSYLATHGVTLIGVTSELEIRYRRVQSRGGTTDHIDFATFREQDERESSGKSFGQQLNAALGRCHLHVTNNGTLGDLHNQLEQIITSHGVLHGLSND